MHHEPTGRQLTTLSAAHQKQNVSVKARRSKSARLGLPALRKHETKKVHFEPPVSARIVSPEGNGSTACEVKTVWATGARLRAKHRPPFRFILLFAWSPTVVSRVCRRVRCRGEEIWVDYVQQRPCYSME
jgi:hypothetical protein